MNMSPITCLGCWMVVRESCLKSSFRTEILVRFIQNFLHQDCDGRTEVCKVKGRATEDVVQRGEVREMARDGHRRGDADAEMGRLRHPCVLDAGHRCATACHLWFPEALDLQRFMIALQQAILNVDGSGGLAPHPTVWGAWGAGRGYLEDGGRVTEDIREFAILLGACCLVERQLRRKTNELGSRAAEAWELSKKAL